MLALLIAVYFAFFRSDYVVLARDLRPGEAGAIVQELKKQEVSYRLEAQGSTILVPASQADELRLSIVAGGVADPGSVGFELFNESDMGLTDFAQKVNYQRALQGELARTIMGMDGIAFARVHLALPERSLFRTNRSEPSAAVTVVPKPSIMLDAARIAGIQRLVASTVTDLKIEHVAVLNQRGQLMTSDAAQVAPDRMANATALEKAYAERIGRAISSFAPDLSFDLKVTNIQLSTGSGDADAARPDHRDHAIRVVVFTASPVAPEQQADLSRIIAQVIGAKLEAGDDIQFSLMAPPAAALPIEPASISTAAQSMDHDKRTEPLLSWWFEAILLVSFALFSLLGWWALRRQRLSRRERLYLRIRDQLRIEHAGA